MELLILKQKMGERLFKIDTEDYNGYVNQYSKAYIRHLSWK